MDEELYSKPSKSALKRAHQERQQLVEKLCKLRNTKFKTLELPERVMEELLVARDMKPSSARNRQFRFITNLMAELDDEQIATLASSLD